MGANRKSDMVAEIIRSQILSGQYECGASLQAEVKLASEFDVSRGTIREALLLLENEGYIVRKHGAGSYVTVRTDRIISGIENLESWTNPIIKAGFQVEVRVLDIDFLPLEDLAAKLNVSSHTPGVRICNLRLADGCPLLYAEDVFPISFINNVDVWKVKESYDSIIGFLEEIGRPAQRFVSTIQAVKAGDLASILKVEPDEPLLNISGILYDNEFAPLTVSKYFFRSDKYQFSLVRSK